MSTSLSTGAPKGTLPQIPKDCRIGIVTAEWNSHITGALTKGATDLLDAQGVEYDTFTVPGTVELTFGASHLIETGEYSAVIIFGCVIRGGTPHFDYVCQSVTQGMTMLNADCDTPVIFGVLTVDAEEDAMDRAGGKLGNKGTEAAEAAIKMIDFVCKVQ